MSTGAAPTLYCSRCGQPTDAMAQFCQKCGTPMPAGGAVALPTGHYGGFWIRVLATLLDGVIVGVCCSPFILFMLPGIFKAAQAGQTGGEPDPAVIGAMMGGIMMFQLSCVAVNWLYEALMTSSAKQATVGKLALGMKVTDLNGQRLTFARATGRFFAKMLNSFIFGIGYFMVAFTARKQGLHDIIAGTLVVKK